MMIADSRPSGSENVLRMFLLFPRDCSAYWLQCGFALCYISLPASLGSYPDYGWSGLIHNGFCL